MVDNRGNELTFTDVQHRKQRKKKITEYTAGLTGEVSELNIEINMGWGVVRVGGEVTVDVCRPNPPYDKKLSGSDEKCLFINYW